MTDRVLCIVERKNSIENKWEILVKLICTTLDEATDLLNSYTEDKFDIYEYRIRECNQSEFNAIPCLIMFSPTIKRDS